MARSEFELGEVLVRRRLSRNPYRSGSVLEDRDGTALAWIKVPSATASGE